MTETLAISVKNVSKSYRVWKKPNARIIAPIYKYIGKRIGGSLGNKLRKKAENLYSDVHALSDISFDIPKGGSFGIVGRNGSGKSTILQIIAGTLNPTGGSVKINGKIAALLELGAGFNFEFTGRENVYLNASIMGLTHEEISKRFKSIEEFAEIGDFIDRPVKTYSSGMVVRLAFSVIAHVDADILIVDEALAVGDVFFVQKCMRFLRKFQETGVLLFVSHDMHSVNNLCDNAIWLVDGKVQMKGFPKDITEAYFGHYYLGLSANEVTQKKKDIAEAKKSNEQPSDHRIGEVVHDQRLKFLNQSEHRNDIEVFHFDSFGDSFGEMEAKVIDVAILDEEEKKLSWMVGGEIVKVKVTAEAYKDLDQLIIGFSIKDKMGQVLFGDNTFLTTQENPLSIKKGHRAHAIFTFQIPILRAADYTITATVATGTQKEHTMQHWLHDAIAFRSMTTSDSTGLIGLPMIDIQLCDNSDN
jgi:lipopolysaccharide transport system ATP-binding protein